MAILHAKMKIPVKRKKGGHSIYQPKALAEIKCILTDSKFLILNLYLCKCIFCEFTFKPRNFFQLVLSLYFCSLDG